MVSVSLRHERAATPEQNTIVFAAHTYPVSGPDPARETIGTDERAEPVGTAEVFETSAEFDWDHPENDPSHPRYEPPHLRHRPGDTWQIGGKPFDIEDTGPYGNPLWRPDRRTGRHRRGELPDPLPPESEAGTEPTPSPVADPRPSPGSVASPRPSPGPRRRGFWTEADPEHATGPERRRLESDADHPEQDGGGYRFDRLREDAWGAFMTDSAPLAAAHDQDRSYRRRRTTAFEREAGGAWALWIALCKWLLALIRSAQTVSAAMDTVPATARTAITTSAKATGTAGTTRVGAAWQGDGLRPSFCSPESPESSAPAGSTTTGLEAGPGMAPESGTAAGSTVTCPTASPRLQKERGALTLPASRTHHTARPATRTQTTTGTATVTAIADSAMARAIAGARRARAQRPRAQRTRAGVAAWA